MSSDVPSERAAAVFERVTDVETEAPESRSSQLEQTASILGALFPTVALGGLALAASHGSTSIGAPKRSVPSVRDPGELQAVRVEILHRSVYIQIGGYRTA